MNLDRELRQLTGQPRWRLTQRGLIAAFFLMLLVGLLVGGLIEDHWLGGSL